MSLVFQINQMTASLEAARKGFAEATQHYNSIKALRGQDGYSITIGGVKIDVAVNAGRECGWAARMIRGRDMIHLGVLKVLDGEIDVWRARIKQCSLTGLPKKRGVMHERFQRRDGHSVSQGASLW